MTDSWNRTKDFFNKFKDLATLGFANVIANLISGLFWLYVARILGTGGYGEVSYFIAIASVASIVSFLGIGNTLIVYTAKGEKLFASLSFIAFISSGITASILFLIYHDIGISVYIIGYAIFTLAYSEVLGLKMYRTYSKYLILQRVILVGIAIGLYYIVGPHGIILGYALSFLPFVVIIFKQLKGMRINLSLLKPKLGFMTNSYALDLSRAFSGYTDKLIIGPLFGFSLLGNYQLGIQVLLVLTTLPSIVYTYILPHDAVGKSNKKLKQITIICSTIIAIASVVLTPIVLPILFPKFTSAIQVVQITSLATIPLAINLTYISKFLGAENSRLVLIGSGIYLLVQILGIIVLGKILGINGVGMALVLAATSEAIYLTCMDRLGKIKDFMRNSKT